MDSLKGLPYRKVNESLKKYNPPQQTINKYQKNFRAGAPMLYHFGVDALSLCDELRNHKDLRDLMRIYKQHKESPPSVSGMLYMYIRTIERHDHSFVIYTSTIDHLFPDLSHGASCMQSKHSTTELYPQLRILGINHCKSIAQYFITLFVNSYWAYTDNASALQLQVQLLFIHVNNIMIAV
ncbi:hypothetical protein H8356DRAFT_1362610 [Neocallimastix lanati (nom. inval.)]|nr:hypothetical protein H8356DRAFT_1362610 [Neocallimastix sp. JGI-2020a]